MKTAAHINLSGDRPNRWGFLTGNIQDQVDLVDLLSSKASHDDVDDLNQALDNILVSLENLSDEIDSKASADSVIQALSTKADLVNGVVPAAQLPAFVDDVLNGKLINETTFQDENEDIYDPESGKIYIDVETNKTYRWSGIKYIVISDSLALGETESTAGRGDYTKAAYDHSLSQGNPHNATTSDIPEGNKLYFTKDRVLQAALIGLNTTNPAPVTATDALLAAIGKLQAQINNVGSGGSSGGVTWVKANTIGTVHPSIIAANNFIELARINGMLWIRGFFKNTGPIVYESQPLFLRIDAIAYKILQRISANGIMFRITAQSSGNLSTTIAFYTSGICVDASSASTSIQYFNIVNTTLQPPSDFYYIPPTCLGELAIK